MSDVQVNENLLWERRWGAVVTYREGYKNERLLMGGRYNG